LFFDFRFGEKATRVLILKKNYTWILCQVFRPMSKRRRLTGGNFLLMTRMILKIENLSQSVYEVITLNNYGFARLKFRAKPHKSNLNTVED